MIIKWFAKKLVEAATALDEEEKRKHSNTISTEVASCPPPDVDSMIIRINSAIGGNLITFTHQQAYDDYTIKEKTKPTSYIITNDDDFAKCVADLINAELLKK
jgi:hypothetical protein